MYEPPSISSFWQQYLDSLPKIERPRSAAYNFGAFGDTEEEAEECARLVEAGIKTATCGLLWEYEFDHENLPVVGENSIVTGRDGLPQCVTEVTEIVIKPFDEVDEQFAYDYGEWDRTLVSWRKGNWAYFSRVCDKIGRTPSETMPLVCLRFRVVYPK